MSLFGEFLSELAQTAVRDGLIGMIQKWREPKESPPVDHERARIVAKRWKDRANRRKGK